MNAVRAKTALIASSLLFFSFSSHAQDPMVDALDDYSQCLIAGATGEEPVEVASLDDLEPLRILCEDKLEALGKIMPLEYLGPIIEEVENTTISLINENQ